MEGELFCSNCGSRLPGGWVEPPPTAAFIDSARLREPLPAASSALASLQPGQIAISIAGIPQVIMLEGRPEYILGREGHEQQVPDLNLNLYGGREKGVSRLHASLRLDRNQLLLVDLGSTNGTRLNGVPLSAHEPARLTDGDEIRLGKLTLKIHFML